MKRIIGFIIVAIIAIVAVSCEADAFDPALPESGEGQGPLPTKPIKRRPIVPTTRLPRPRVIGYENLSNGTLSSYEVVELEPESEEFYEE
jgi:hypothetical protein